jgi:hypothetical protein
MFLVQLGLAVITAEFPCSNVAKIFVVAHGFVAFGLKFFVKMPAAGFLARAGIDQHQFAEFKKVRHPPGPLEALVELALVTGDFDVFPEFGAQILDQAAGDLAPLVLGGPGATLGLFSPAHLHTHACDTGWHNRKGSASSPAEAVRASSTSGLR